MKEGKIYFHPLVGGHFGMYMAESMAAGLIPIGPSVGAPTEYVPKKFHLRTLEEAAGKISFTFRISRHEIGILVHSFSISGRLHHKLSQGSHRIVILRPRLV